MEMSDAAAVLSALALESRLAVFRLLIRSGPEGLMAGDVAKTLGARANTLSQNLKILSQAGLIEARRDGRAIIYTARYDKMRDLLSFLLDDCCNGRPEICLPLMDIATRAVCCADDQAEHDETLK